VEPGMLTIITSDLGIPKIMSFSIALKIVLFTNCNKVQGTPTIMTRSNRNNIKIHATVYRIL
jgi:hypothetical protein